MVYPSATVRKMYSWWEEFWEEWVPRVTRGEPFFVIHNGDAIDGRHHNTTSQISHNLADQRAMASALLKPVVEKCDGHFYLVKGTEAHVGQSGEDEETLGEMIGAKKTPDGEFAFNELYIRVGKSLCHFAHHVGTTSAASYESTGVYKEMVEAFVEAGRNNLEPPQCVIRSHRHRQFEVRIATARGYGISMVTPGWQLRTPFVYRLGMKMALPQLGGYVIREGDEELYTRFYVKSIERSREEVLA